MNNVIKTSQAINKGLIKEAWWRFPYVRNQFEWDKAIEKLQEVGGQVNISFIILYLKYYMLILFLQAAVNYVEALDKSTFTAWKVKGPRYGHTTSSTAESTNSAIQDERKLGILELLDGFWTRTSRQRVAFTNEAKELMA